jgi:hypothetical protein
MKYITVLNILVLAYPFEDTDKHWLYFHLILQVNIAAVDFHVVLEFYVQFLFFVVLAVSVIGINMPI